MPIQSEKGGESGDHLGGTSTTRWDAHAEAEALLQEGPGHHHRRRSEPDHPGTLFALAMSSQLSISIPNRLDDAARTNYSTAFKGRWKKAPWSGAFPMTRGQTSGSGGYLLYKKDKLADAVPPASTALVAIEEKAGVREPKRTPQGA